MKLRNKIPNIFNQLLNVLFSIFGKRSIKGRHTAAYKRYLIDESSKTIHPKRLAKRVALKDKLQDIKNTVVEYVKGINWVLMIIAIVCTIYGIIIIKSASGDNSLVKVQLSALALGVAIYLLLSLFDISHLAVFWKPVMAAGIVMLLTVLVFGRSAGGNSGWISITLGSLNLGFQPGEVVKIIMIITLSKHLDLVGNDIVKLKNVVLISIHFAIYAGALLFSKDDGMLFSYIIIFIIVVFASGIKLRYLAIGAGAFVAITPILWNFVMDYYQKMRLLVVLDPTLDLEGIGYQAYISKTAISNGGLIGMGLGNGAVTQFSKPGNLPAKYTDFVFSVICEELGYLGGLLAIIMLIGIIAVCLYIARKVRHDKFSYLVTIGVAAMFTFQTFLNIGMCLGLVPVIGLTLPFFSYGGSSILTMFVSLGMVASIGMHIRPRTLSDIY